MIEGLILPEWMTGSPQQLIRFLSGNAFHELSNLRCRDLRVNQDVNVIRHHNKRYEVI